MTRSINVITGLRFFSKTFGLGIFVMLVGSSQVSISQVENSEIISLVQAFKNDARGPYKDIRWFCKDGSTLPPKERCPEKGGVQRARYKDRVVSLGNTNHIYLGQILSKTDFDEFLDAAHGHSRMKQFQLEKFLRAADDGWINRKAQYYRGAYQIEDEQTWGSEFLVWLVKNHSLHNRQFYLARQIARDLPHGKDTQVAQNVRAVSKDIADAYPAFMELRIKIHGQPESKNLEEVKAFFARHKSKIDAQLTKKFERLIADMEVMYRPFGIEELAPLLNSKGGTTTASKLLDQVIVDYKAAKSPSRKCEIIAQASLDFRSVIQETTSAELRVGVLDVTLELESMLIKQCSQWSTQTLSEHWGKLHCLTKASAGFGYMELWEWEEIQTRILPDSKNQLTLGRLSELLDGSRLALEWCTGMIRGTYDEVLNLYMGFEPLAGGFVDDQVRSSILLPLGDCISRLGTHFAKQAGIANNVLNIEGQSSIRGLNPGYAVGTLVVTSESPESLEIIKDNIYVFNRPPSDLKPVAGIATVTEGNMVSHVQLLARNLGIPNAVFSAENLKSLKKYGGKRVFYAVSVKGNVIMKLAEDMTSEEKALFTKVVRKDERISVAVDKLILDKPRVMNLADIDASFSGKACGPKAANLGQLKQMFPEMVVDGLVIPFSVFKAHFDQKMPVQKVTYWEFLKSTFKQASSMADTGATPGDIEIFILDRLAVLRAAIKEMPLLPEFVADFKTSFRSILGKDLGSVPVFVRSDTNMEDLKDFTGAGLNLTLFNVLSADKIFQGIKDVWASPYTERSYKWRQTYLLNPENVFPSILIIPSVNADVSGVMITKGLTSGDMNDVTIAFSRGVGGAVDGQASETWLLSKSGKSVLLAPARESVFTQVPASGGISKTHTDFHEPLLPKPKLAALRAQSELIKDRFAKMGNNGPHDVELGIKGSNIWLFQIRPFVENKKASSSEYLNSLTPVIDENKPIDKNAIL